MPRFQDIQLDVVGPLEPSNGHRYLLTIVDRTSRYLAAIPMPAATSQNCATAFIEGWCQHFGVPSYARSDNATNFTSKMWTHLHQSLGTIVSYSPLYRPQAMGMIERQHAPLKTGLRAALMAMGDEYGKNWTSILPWILLGRRTSWHEELGATPSQMTLGEDPPLPGDMLPIPSQETIQQILNRVTKTVTRPPAQTALRRSPRFYMPDKAKEATHVWVKKAKRTPLEPLFDGPYKIVEKLGDSSLRIKTGDLNNGKERIEIRHWNTCQPAVIAPGEEAAAKPPLGRRPLNPKAPRFKERSRV